MRIRRPAACGLALTLLVALLLSACTAEDGFHLNGGGDASPGVSDPTYQRTPPPVQQAVFTAGGNVISRDDGDPSAVIDLTNIAKGYVGVQCTSSVKTQLRVIKEPESEGLIDGYPLRGDGSTQFFPLSRGSGTYTVRLYVFLRTGANGDEYIRFLEPSFEVSLESEFAPFLVQSQIVNYSESSQCVQKSYEILAHCKTDLEVVQQVYDWISKNIDYDTEKAANIQALAAEGYVPDPDETLRSGKGICYDYASLAAAMLRANGVPTRLVKGNVLTGDGQDVYHAWNLVWVQEVGWIAVELPTRPGEWSRIDTTFAAAGGGMGSFIGDGENYTDMSYH